MVHGGIASPILIGSSRQKKRWERGRKKLSVDVSAAPIGRNREPSPRAAAGVRRTYRPDGPGVARAMSGRETQVGPYGVHALEFD